MAGRVLFACLGLLAAGCAAPRTIPVPVGAPRPQPSAEQIQEPISEKRSVAGERKFQEAVDRLDQNRQSLDFAEGDPSRDPAQDARKLRDALETTLEFEEIPLDIQGRVVFEESQRGLLINDKVYMEGEQGTDEVLLYRIRIEPTVCEADFLFRQLLAALASFPFFGTFPVQFHFFFNVIDE